MSTVNKGMRLRVYTTVLFTALLAFRSVFSQVQPPEPERQELLNGLRVLIWQRQGSQDLLIKLRIHSGAAFDLAGKSGSMCVLGDILFPDAATVEFFTEEMGGKLDVATDLDSLTITMQGRATEFERIIEILRNALVSTQLTPEIVARQRERRIKIIKDSAVVPSIVADRAISARLFGDFPYGRPSNGSAEDLVRVERPDLMLARERFLNPNNATLTIVGGIDRARAMRALRQLLGSWRKSESIIPTTFRRANEPDTRTLIINGPADQTAEVRIAVRGLARSDPDYPAASILALIADQRWAALSPELKMKAHFVRNEGHVLPGMFVMGASINSKSTAAVIQSSKKVMDSLSGNMVTPAELEQARNELLVQLTNRLAKSETLVDVWLDADTFRLPSASEQLQVLRSTTAADVQRLANRLFRNAPTASIALGDTQQLKAELEGHLPTEVLGEVPKPNPTQTEIKPATKPNIATKP